MAVLVVPMLQRVVAHVAFVQRDLTLSVVLLVHNAFLAPSLLMAPRHVHLAQ